MPNKTPIEYADYTSNPIYARHRETGKRGWFCVHASEGCRRCYAEALNKRWGNGLAFIGSNSFNAVFGVSLKELDALAALDARLVKKGEAAVVFVGDMLDIFYPGVSDALLDQVFGYLDALKALTVLVLTKRAGRQRSYLTKRWGGSPPAHIRVGVSAENQEWADKRLPELLRTSAAYRWVSVEPQLGPVDLGRYLDPTGFQCIDPDCVHYYRPFVDPGEYETTDSNDPVCLDCGQVGTWTGYEPGLDWVVCGGESGPGARLFNVNWARDIVRQCQAGDVPAFVKQLGARPILTELAELPDNQIGEDGTAHWWTLDFIRDSKGGDINEWPQDLRVRQFPAVNA